MKTEPMLTYLFPRRHWRYLCAWGGVKYLALAACALALKNRKDVCYV